MKVNTQLNSLLQPAVEAAGYEFWGCEYISQGKYSVLRVYIDSAAGITVDDCAVASQQISAVLDVEDPIKGNYTLEVSSPGMDRPLYTIEQFERYLGQTIQLQTHAPIEGQRKFKGVLQNIEDNNIVINVEQQELVLPLADIMKANLFMG